MKYTHVLSYVRGALWAISRDKIEEIIDVLVYRAAGHEFSAEEIQARIGDGTTTPQPRTQGVTALIPLRGTITHRMGGMAESSGGMSAERFTKMIQQAAADPSVSAIVIDTDSPGGTVNGVSEAADAVYQARQSKPVVAVANGMMASAAYWIASQAHEVIAVPSLVDASIGSIGVYTVRQDLSEALAKQGIKTTIISAGKFKIEGSPTEPLSDEAKATLQKAVNAAYASFTGAVARGRGVDQAAVQNGYGEGHALSAVDAKRAGLVDRIATMDETLARLASPQVRGKIMGGMRVSVEDEANLMAADLALAEIGGVVAEHLAQETDGADRELARRILY
jgi:signal peptide peptidase SppA